MINKIEIKNFKGIGEPVSVELKPITLLFGPNSAGKSTIIQAFHYASEILRGNFNPSITQFGGSHVNLGSFYNIVHNHDENRVISLKFHIKLNGEFLPDLSQNPLYFNYDEFEEIKAVDSTYDSFEDFSDEFNSAIISIDIAKNKVTGNVRATRYSLVVNDESFATISIEDSNPRNTYTYFSSINIDHPLLKDKISDELRGTYFENITKTDLNNFVKIQNSDSVIPLQDEIRIDPYHFEMHNFGVDDPSELTSLVNNYKDLLRLLCWALVSSTKLLREDLTALLYIGPLRELPSRNFNPIIPIEKVRWFNGLGAWDMLYESSDMIRRTNFWLNKLNIPYKLELVTLLELDERAVSQIKNQAFEQSGAFEKIADIIDGQNALDDTLRYETIKSIFDIFAESRITLSEQLLKNRNSKKLYLVDSNDVRLSPKDLGVGVSQVIPIIVAALKPNEYLRSIIAIEQPELHVHPAIQVELADLFIEAATHGNNFLELPNYFIVETHSEHLMLRFLRRIEQTGKKKDVKYPLTPDKINVYWCEPSKDGLKVDLLPVDETGEFTRQWPRGFFEERAEELFPDD